MDFNDIHLFLSVIHVFAVVLWIGAGAILSTQVDPVIASTTDRGFLVNLFAVYKKQTKISLYIGLLALLLMSSAEYIGALTA